MRRGFLVLGAFCALMPLAAAAQNAYDPQNVQKAEVLLVGKGAHAAENRETTIVATDRSGWDYMWARIGKMPPSGGLKEGQMAVAILIGERRTAGYDVEIVSAEEDIDSLVVYYRVRSPDEGANMLSQVITSPYAVAVMPKSDKPVRTEIFK